MKKILSILITSLFFTISANAAGMIGIKAGTGSKAEVNAGETLFAKVSFGGSILYKGDPEVIKNKKTAGGIIKQMN